MRALLTAILAAFVLTSCAAEERRAAPAPAPQRPPKLPSPAVAQRPAPSNAGYVAAAGSIDLFEIRSSELALQRSVDRRVRDFALMMINAHKGTSSQLSLAGRRLNLLPSALLRPKHQAMLDQLRASPNFDTLYRQQQLATHREALALHREYWARGTSPTLRPVAIAAYPVIERHLRMIRYL